jgi:phage-related protein
MEFTFNNKSSRDFNIKIKKSNHLSIPRRKLEFVEIQGRTDNLIINEGSREMLDIEIEAYIDCRNENTYSYALRLDEWLNGVNGYLNLIFDDGTKLKAIFVGQIDFNSITKNFEEILLQFKAYREGDL